MLMCWFLPFCLIIGVAAYYIISNQYGARAESVVDQLVYNNQICVERMNAAITASRKATYDQTLEKAWRSYSRGETAYNSLYSVSNDYISREYRQNQCFSATILWSYEDPEKMNQGIYNNAAGGTYQQVQTYWQEDHERVKAYLETLDTSLGYIDIDGRLYMVRNLLDNSYHPFGALIMRLNTSYCFGPLIDYPQAESVTVRLDGQDILLKGSAEEEHAAIPVVRDGQSGYLHKNGDLYVYDIQKEDYYELAVLMKAYQEAIQAPFYGYTTVFAGMLLFLFPLLLLLLKVFRENVTKPVESLTEGATRVQEGDLGYRIEEKQDNLEFQYLTDVFNQMSERLKYQFDHIYEEELALRDAKIMALQSNINPHFMNNTLEIINWEARMGGNEKVSRMIEALSTLMDGAMDRKKRALVLLSEEMVYVNAYLYINTERFGKRLTVEKELDEDIMQYEVPRLILQPVIENAIEHGVRPSGHGTVTIRGYADEDYLYLEIVNDGTISQEDGEKIKRLLSPDYDASKEPSGNLGIANVNQRLRILYGDPCGLVIEKEGENHVVARLTIAIR